MKQRHLVNFNVPEGERRRLDNYAKSTSRTRTELLREFIRSLPDVETDKRDAEARTSSAC